MKNDTNIAPKKSNLKVTLISASIALAFFIGVIVNRFFMPK